MRALLCSINDSVWDIVEIGWTRPKVAKSTWDKATLAATNANSKALNANFCGVSPENFTRSLMLQLPIRHGKSWRRPTKAPKR